MKNTRKTILATAAISGLLGGIAHNQARAAAPPNSIAGKAAPAKLVPVVHGCSGTNDCKGIGGCKTDAHACKFKNDCKGKGGCELDAQDIKDWEKQQNSSKSSSKPATDSATKAPVTK